MNIIILQLLYHKSWLDINPRSATLPLCRSNSSSLQLQGLMPEKGASKLVTWLKKYMTDYHVILMPTYKCSQHFMSLEIDANKGLNFTVQRKRKAWVLSINAFDNLKRRQIHLQLVTRTIRGRRPKALNK